MTIEVVIIIISISVFFQILLFNSYKQYKKLEIKHKKLCNLYQKDDIIELKSVGAFLDKKTLMVSPDMDDMESGTYLTECTEEWFNSLSEIDNDLVWTLYPMNEIFSNHE